MIAIGPLAGLVAALVMVLTIWAPSAVLAGVSFFLMGAGPIVWVISTTTLRQTVTPPHAARPRVSPQHRRLWRAADRRRHRRRHRRLLRRGGLSRGRALGFLVQAGTILASPVVRLARLPGSPRRGAPFRSAVRALSCRKKMSAFPRTPAAFIAFRRAADLVNFLA